MSNSAYLGLVDALDWARERSSSRREKMSSGVQPLNASRSFELNLRACATSAGEAASFKSSA